MMEMMNKETILSSVAIVIFAAYIYTLSPGIAGGDSGEIVAEGCQLGIAHPPGYPLITILIHLISKLNALGTVAYRTNVFCAFCTTVAVYSMGLMIPSVLGAVVTMTAFAFSPLIWQYAVTSEVFPLNTMFAALIVYLTYSFSKKPSLLTAYAGALVCGLALCNQHTIVLFEAPLILWIVFLLRREWLKDFRLALGLAGSFFFGLLPYLYLPLSAHFNLRHGSWGDLRTPEGFVHHFLRRDYGTFQLFSGAAGKNAEGLAVRNEAYLRDLHTVQGSTLLSILAVVGLIGIIGFIRLDTSASMLSAQPKSSKANQINAKAHGQSAGKGRGKKSKDSSNKTAETPSVQSTPEAEPSASESKYALLVDGGECKYTYLIFLATHLFYLLVFHSLANLPLKDKLLFGVHQRFWMQPNIIYFMYVGFGVDSLSRLVNYLLGKTGSTKSNQYTHYILNALFIIMATTVAYMQFTNNFFLSNQSDALYFNQYASAVLSPLPPGSVLLINYDQQWTSVRYMQMCENYRTDITAMQLSMMTFKWFKDRRELYSNLTFPGSFVTYPNSPLIAAEKAFTVYDFLKANPDKQVFLGGKLNYPDDRLAKEFDMMPVGLVSRFTPLKALPNGVTYNKQLLSSWKKVRKELPTLPDVQKYPEETWEWTIGRDYKDRVVDASAFLLQLAIESAPVDPKPLVNAVYWIETSYYFESQSKSIPASLYKNAGLAHLHLVQNKLLKEEPLPVPVDVHQTLDSIEWPRGRNWKEWSGVRFVFFWKTYLEQPEAKGDPQYSTIKQMYEKVAKAAGL